ncbi:MAG: alpha-glucosidase [Clostridiales bacterium]|nr:alpha-glucosidase [Clostridiales bacterium]
MEKKWWQKSVIYQIYPKSFCDSNGDGIGDLEGIRSKIWYLKKLGIDVVWLSPVYKSPGDDNGYDISDYYDIDPAYGTMEEMKQLILECQKAGIRIVMDLVVNHTSDEHPWFLEAASGKDSPCREYYIWRDGKDGCPPNDLQSNFGGSAWEYSEQTDQYYLHFYGKKQPDLNWENEKLRKKIWEMMNYWIDLGVGGFRMDVIDLIGKVPDQGIKENGPRLHEYLQEMNRETFGKHDLLTVGECWGATPQEGYLYSAPERRELSMIFQFEQIQLDKQPGGHRWDLKPLVLTELKQVFTKWQTEMEGRGWNSLFLSNHDLPRIVSRWGDDGVYRVESAKMLATLLHGMKGTVYIYQGEELGMTNGCFDRIEDFCDIESRNMYMERRKAGYTDEDILRSLRAKARDNARTPMQWTGGYQAGFTTGTPWYRVNPNYVTINAKQAMEDPDSVFSYYQKLIRLRHENEVMVYGTYELLAEEDEDVYAYTRTLGTEKWLIVCNFHGRRAEFSWKGQGQVIISNYEDPGCDLETLKLRPYEAVIYRVEQEA